MKRIELVLDRACPNADAARELLRTVLGEIGIPACWHEWDRESPDAPTYVRQYGSPTILVDGSDVSGQAAPSEANSCRVYRDAAGGLSGVPARELVRAALLRGDSA